jgi:hypothetical protein
MLEAMATTHFTLVTTTVCGDSRTTEELKGRKRIERYDPVGYNCYVVTVCKQDIDCSRNR